MGFDLFRQPIGLPLGLMSLKHNDWTDHARKFTVEQALSPFSLHARGGLVWRVEKRIVNVWIGF